MAKRQIIIELGANTNLEADVTWVVVEAGQRPGPVFRGDLKTAANHATGCKVIVLVPGSEIFLTEVDIPQMNRQRLLKAIPFALEETVATDLEDLHFALGKRTPADTLSVAVVDQGQIGQWLERLKRAGIQADALYPVVYGLPEEDQTWTLLLTGSDEQDLTVLRQAQQVGMSFELQNMLPYLTLAIEQCEPESRPEVLRVVQCDAGYVDAFANPESGDEPTLQLDAEFEPEDLSTLDAKPIPNESSLPYRESRQQNGADQSVAEDVGAEQAARNPYSSVGQASDAQVRNAALVDKLRALCDASDIRMEQVIHSDVPLLYYANNVDENAALNILQGEYSRKEQLEKLFRPWVPATSVAATWLLIQAGLLLADYIDLSGREAELKEQMDAIYAEAFPEAKPTKFYLREMEGRLASLKSGDAKQSGFIPLLHQTGEVLKDTKGMTISGIRYKSNQLDINMEISDLQALDTLKENLMSKADVNVEIVSASARDGKVNSRIQVEPKS